MNGVISGIEYLRIYTYKPYKNQVYIYGINSNTCSNANCNTGNTIGNAVTRGEGEQYGISNQGIDIQVLSGNVIIALVTDSNSFNYNNIYIWIELHSLVQ